MLLIGSMRFAIVNVSYEANKQNIIKYLCENVDKPALQCNGKCFLNKTLNKARENPESQKEINSGFLFKIDLFRTLSKSLLFNHKTIEQTLNTYYLPLIKGKYITKVFRPPTQLRYR